MKLSSKDIEDKLSFIGGITHDLREMETVVKFAQRLPPNPTILETGTCFGKSACSWVLATGGHVWTMEMSKQRVSVARNNIKTLGLQDHIDVINCNSETHPWKKEVNVVWLDSDHSEEHLTKEIKKYLPYAKHLICGHDYNHPDFPGVKVAIDKCLGDYEYDRTIWYKWLKY